MSFLPVQIRLAQLKPISKPLLIRTEAIFDFDSLLGVLGQLTKKSAKNKI